jgi:heterodisulfide reductase subunit B
MAYAYYPGCSLTGSASEYDLSTRLVMEKLGVELNEIPDWTCCGASAAEAVSELAGYALPARNLALAAEHLPGQDVLAPCNACYLNLLRVTRKAADDRELAGRIDTALSAEDMRLPRSIRVRHLLDVLVNDVGAQAVAEQVRRPLEGVTVAPYYGCQVLRPYRVFDDPERPTSMTPLLEAVGATPLDWDKGGKCCGASLMTTKKNVALPSVRSILTAARDADLIVTVCPMCQMNLEAFQREALAGTGIERPFTILYLPQLMGLAFGLSAEEMAIGRNLAVRPETIDSMTAPAPREEGSRANQEEVSHV